MARFIGGLFPLIHLGRPWIFWYMVPIPTYRGIWPNFSSPLMWDILAITTYLTGSLLYLYLPLIPDFALLAKRTEGFRSKIYAKLSLGWTGSDRQWMALERVNKLMAGIILAIAVWVLRSLPQWRLARAEKAVEAAPESAEALITRGRARLTVDDASGAVEDGEKAIALGLEAVAA